MSEYSPPMASRILPTEDWLITADDDGIPRHFLAQKLKKQYALFELRTETQRLPLVRRFASVDAAVEHIDDLFAPEADGVDEEEIDL
jgi:hypothetical protein